MLLLVMSFKHYKKIVSLYLFILLFSKSLFTCLSLLSNASVLSLVDHHFLKLYTLHVLKYILYIFYRH